MYALEFGLDKSVGPGDEQKALVGIQFTCLFYTGNLNGVRDFPKVTSLAGEEPGLGPWLLIPSQVCSIPH